MSDTKNTSDPAIVEWSSTDGDRDPEIDSNDESPEYYKRKIARNEEDRKNFIADLASRVSTKIVQTDPTHEYDKDDDNYDKKEDISFCAMAHSIVELEYMIDRAVDRQRRLLKDLKTDMDRWLTIYADDPIYDVLKKHFDSVLLEISINSNSLDMKNILTFSLDRYDIISSLGLSHRDRNIKDYKNALYRQEKGMSVGNYRRDSV